MRLPLAGELLHLPGKPAGVAESETYEVETGSTIWLVTINEVHDELPH